LKTFELADPVAGIIDAVDQLRVLLTDGISFVKNGHPAGKVFENLDLVHFDGFEFNPVDISDIQNQGILKKTIFDDFQDGNEVGLGDNESIHKFYHHDVIRIDFQGIIYFVMSQFSSPLWLYPIDR
jgi:hypothetical protein